MNNNRFRNGQAANLTLVSRGGSVLSKSITSMWTPQDLGIQFAGGVA